MHRAFSSRPFCDSYILLLSQLRNEQGASTKRGETFEQLFHQKLQFEF
jgi:hypothetical protein